MCHTKKSGGNISRLMAVIGLVFLAFTMGNSDVSRAETTLEFFDRVDPNRMTAHRDKAIVYWGGAAAPVGRFLLIRYENAMCALLLRDFRQAGDSKPQTMFTTGAEHRYAEYDWYFQSDGSGDFTRQSTESGHDTLEDGPLIGIGRLAFHTGDILINCGPIELIWSYPDSVHFFAGSKIRDYGFELAPTSWSDLSSIRATDPNLIWYRYDEERTPKLIPVSELLK